jgi:hypothetical protein
LKKVLEANPNVILALVGDGPAKGELQKLFEGLPANFVGEWKG